MKEIGMAELLGRWLARGGLAAGVIALVLWLTWVMLDLRHLQSGFTLP